MNVLRTQTSARAALALALAAMCGSALAATSFDPAAGTGTVGKQSVQTAFGWNNHTYQNNVSGLTYTYEAVTNHAAVCNYIGYKRIASRTAYFTTSIGVNVNGHVVLNGNNAQALRHDLTGYGDIIFESGQGSLPVPGTRCSGLDPQRPGYWSSVTPVLQGSEGGLYVNYGTQKALIFP